MSEAIVVGLITAAASVSVAFITGYYLLQSKRIEKGENIPKKKFTINPSLRIFVWALLLAILASPLSWSLAFIGNVLDIGKTEIYIKDASRYKQVAPQ
jgi:hypothetical protein